MTAGRDRLIRTALWPIGLTYGVVGEYFSVHNHVQENHLLDLLVGLALIAAGLISWSRRPDSRVGKLLALAGFLWFLGNYSNAHVPWLFSLGHGFSGVSVVPLVHAVVSYPSGKLQTRFERAFFIVGYSWSFGLALLTTLTFDPQRDLNCPRCIRGGLAYIHAPGLVTTANNVDGVMSILLPLAAIVLLLVRLKRESPAVRRTLGALWIAGIALALAFVAQGFGDALNLTGVPYSALNATQRMMNIAVPIALMIGLLRIRFVRSTVGDMMVALGEQPGPGRLRDALARTLGDPSLRVAYKVPMMKGYVDADGHPVALPSDARAVTILEADGEPIAALIHDPILSDQREIVEAAGAAARLAIENERLRAEVRAQLEEVRASRARIIEAGDVERRRLERDLHDGAQQRLLALSLALRVAEQRLGPSPDPELTATIDGAKRELDNAIGEIRELARGIHPAILTDEGLAPALDSLAERAPIATRVLRAPVERLSAPVEVTAYFVVSEAITNAAKHAGAGAVTIAVDRADGSLRVEIVDDGVGGADVKRGTGLRGLADRVAAIGGQLTIQSPMGGGTRVVAEIPCV